jgi:hypothetical protein
MSLLGIVTKDERENSLVIALGRHGAVTSWEVCVKRQLLPRYWSIGRVLSGKSHSLNILV